MASSSTKSTVILDRPADWHEWLFIVKNRALDHDVEQLIDPDLATEPPRPTEPLKPTPQDVKSDAHGLTDLNSQQIELFKLLRDEYKIDLAKYERKRTALTQIRQLIISTVSRTNLTYILEKTTPYQMLAALKLRIAPTDRARELETARQYQELKNAPKSQDTEVWLQRWEKVYTEAAKLNIPDVQKDRPIYEFLRTVKSIDSAFSSTHEILVDEKITENKPIPTIYELIAKFRNHIRLNRLLPTESSSSHTAFATLNGEAQDKQTEPWKKECVCGEIHRFKECLYLIDHLRTPEWAPDAEIQKKIDMKLAENEWLRDMVENAQKYANRRTKQAPQKEKKENERPTQSANNESMDKGVFYSHTAF
jgi:hypothetical protein